MVVDPYMEMNALSQSQSVDKDFSEFISPWHGSISGFAAEHYSSPL